MTNQIRMPAVFLGHGSPMNTLETNRYTSTWQQVGESVRTPRAVLVISAHWYVGVTAVTAMARPRTIHDFCPSLPWPASPRRRELLPRFSSMGTTWDHCR